MVFTHAMVTSLGWEIFIMKLKSHVRLKTLQSYPCTLIVQLTLNYHV